jgi:hypothetical protein
VAVARKIEVVAIKTRVVDMEGVIIVEVVTRIEAVALEEATIIEGVVEEGVVVVEAEGGIIIIDRWRYFPCICPSL